MTKDLISQVKKEIEQENVDNEKILIRKMLSLIEVKEKEIADKQAEWNALRIELKELKEDLEEGDYSKVKPKGLYWYGSYCWRSNDTRVNFS